jgi:hypothetical protein
MSETKFTPGSWSIGQRRTAMQDVRPARAVVGPMGEWLAILPHGHVEGFGVVSDEEMEANAHLIAAAPELYAACEKALYALKGREHDGFLRAALAKARGEQP